MKIELYVDGPAVTRAFATFLGEYEKALAEDRKHFEAGALQLGVVGNVKSETPVESAPAADTAAEEGPRMYARAAPGKTRRTKEEMAQDDRIFEKWTKLRGEDTIPIDMPADAFEADLDKALASGGEKQAISETPEDRKDPAQEPEIDNVTRNDLIEALRGLLEANGGDMPKTMARFKELSGFEKQSAVPDDKIATVHAKLRAAIEEAEISG